MAERVAETEWKRVVVLKEQLGEVGAYLVDAPRRAEAGYLGGDRVAGACVTNAADE